MPCNVLYYQSGAGRSPALDFIEALTMVKEQAAVLADVSLLADEGPILPFPWTSALRSHPGLRELRSRFGGTQYRLVYIVKGSDAILLHMFKKTSSAQTLREYRVAADRARRIR